MEHERRRVEQVAFRAEGLDPAQSTAVRDALTGAGIELAGETDEAAATVAVTGPVVAGVKWFKDRALVVSVIVAADRSTVSELLAAGAAGIVALDEVERALPAAVEAVAAGLVVVPAGGRAAIDRPVLSSREKQVLGLVVMGLTNAEIGKRLFLAESTVKYHLLSVYGKLGVKTRKEAADLVLDARNGLDVGVLGIGRGRRRGGGYSEPSVS